MSQSAELHPVPIVLSFDFPKGDQPPEQLPPNFFSSFPFPRPFSSCSMMTSVCQALCSSLSPHIMVSLLRDSSPCFLHQSGCSSFLKCFLPSTTGKWEWPFLPRLLNDPPFQSSPLLSVPCPTLLSTPSHLREWLKDVLPLPGWAPNPSLTLPTLPLLWVITSDSFVLMPPFYQTISLIPAFISFLSQGLLRIQYCSYWTGSLLPPPCPSISAYPHFHTVKAGIALLHKKQEEFFIRWLFLFSLPLICSIFAKVLIPEANNKTLCVCVCLRACVCERERMRRGRERKQYNSLAMWGGIGELLDQGSWLRDANPLLWAQRDPIGSWAAVLKQRRAWRIELHSQTQTLSQVASTLGGREARTHKIAGCPQLDVHLFPERKKREGRKKKNQTRKGGRSLTQSSSPGANNGCDHISVHLRRIWCQLQPPGSFTRDFFREFLYPFPGLWW